MSNIVSPQVLAYRTHPPASPMKFGYSPPSPPRNGVKPSEETNETNDDNENTEILNTETRQDMDKHEHEGDTSVDPGK